MQHNDSPFARLLEYCASIRFNEDCVSYLGVLFGVMYRVPSQSAFVAITNEGKTYCKLRSDISDKFSMKSHKFIDNTKTLKAFESMPCVKVFYVSSYEAIVFSDTYDYDNHTPFMVLVSADDKSSHSSSWTVYTSSVDAFYQQYGKCFIHKDESMPNEFGIATYADGELYTSYFELKQKYTVDIKRDYNDDLPYDKLVSILEDDSKASLVLMYGDPGTGKSSLLKHLMTVVDRDFIFLDSQLLASINPSKFISYLVENEGAVFILEDCEKILMSRDVSRTDVLGTILNVTDGVISDILGIKLVCTFNTDLSNIDRALLRKGRLSLKYEFKKLSKEKAARINPSISKDTTLADIYNNEENDFSKKNTTKIGF